MTKRIPVGSYYALVDDGDYEYLSKFSWAPNQNQHSEVIHARAASRIDDEHGQLMHKLITGFEQTDHANGNGLDNRRENLRPATTSQNQANRGKPVFKRPVTSRFKGVFWDKSRQRWKAEIGLNNRKIYIGKFRSELEAAKAYDQAALKYFGEFAGLNFPDTSWLSDKALARR